MGKIFFLIAIIVGFSACTTEPTDPKGTLEIVFKARYNNLPLVLYQNTPTGQTNPDTAIFKKLDFFISDIKGVSGGITKDFSNVGFISMASSLSQSSAEAGTTFTITDIPLGSYTQLNFGIGLSETLNATSPGDYPSSSPLGGSGGNYWSSWNSYIFSKIEGDVIQSNGTKSGFLYHSGVDGMYQLRNFTKNFTITNGQTTQLVFYINAEDFFFKAGSTIDVLNENVTHSGAVGTAPYNLGLKSIQNLAAALELQP